MKIKKTKLLRNTLLLVSMGTLVSLFQNFSNSKRSKDAYSWPKVIDMPFELVKSPSGGNPQHYPGARRNPKIPGSFTNRTKESLVLKKAFFKIDARGYGRGSAEMDVCIGVIPTRLYEGIKLRNGVESMCAHLSKSDNDVNWPKTNWMIDFPGQGLMVPPGNTVYCHTSATLNKVDHRPALSRFDCRLVFDKVNNASNEAPVQALRAPYIDQRFYTDASWFSPHVNRSRARLRTRGYWVFASTKFAERDFCTYFKKRGRRSWEKHCIPHDVRSGESYASPAGIQPFNRTFNPGDQITANCSVNNYDGRKNNCAFYLFVDVPKGSGRYRALGLNSTIGNYQKKKFCTGPYQKYYKITHEVFQLNRNKCLRALK